MASQSAIQSANPAAARRFGQHRRICRTSAKRVCSIRIRSKNRGIAVDPYLHSPLECMRAVRERHVLLELKKIAVGPENRTGRGIESLEQSVGETNPRLRVVGRWKKRRAANVAQRSFGNQMRSNRPRVLHARVALVI